MGRVWVKRVAWDDWENLVLTGWRISFFCSYCLGLSWAFLIFAWHNVGYCALLYE